VRGAGCGVRGAGCGVRGAGCGTRDTGPGAAETAALRWGGAGVAWRPMVRAVDHINIVVTDLERSLRFYTDVLGFTKTKEAHLEGEWIERIVGLAGVKARAVFIVAPAGEPRIELLCYESPRGEQTKEHSRANTIGLRHIALRVDDIHATAARLQAAGATLFGPPVRVPAGVVQHDAGEKTLIYFLDPDGVILELAEYR
jgi:glyoxylase I family protein